MYPWCIDIHVINVTISMHLEDIDVQNKHMEAIPSGDFVFDNSCLLCAITKGVKAKQRANETMCGVINCLIAV